jgi:hypothetical protein
MQDVVCQTWRVGSWRPAALEKKNTLYCLALAAALLGFTNGLPAPEYYVRGRRPVRSRSSGRGFHQNVC